MHLSVSAGRVGNWQEGANLRTAAKFHSLMALFEALKVLERQPLIRQTLPTATPHGRAEASDVYLLADCAMAHYGPVKALERQIHSSLCTV